MGMQLFGSNYTAEKFGGERPGSVFQPIKKNFPSYFKQNVFSHLSIDFMIHDLLKNVGKMPFVH